MAQKSLLRNKKAKQGQDQQDSTPITRRQQEVLTYIAEGLNNREIADQLNISSRTVEVHRFNLMRRLQVTNVAQLIRQGLLMGLLTKLFRVTEPRA
ncbi:MAG TPA: response regulator transcription factor [Nitrospiraceae bacterium]|jgi:DNA-binding NarL/FixJ family response regulator|nr:response regulator transcription factor [Nitrospiraceae bacterium]